MNTHSHHPSKHPVGRHPDRPARAPRGGSARQTEEPSGRVAGGFSSILRRYPLVLGITALTAALLTTIAAFALYKGPDPTALILPVSAAVPALASLCGGITAGKLNPTTPMAAGLLSGGLTAALLLLISLIFGEGMGLISCGMALGATLFHLLGSAITRPRKVSPVHRSGKHTSRR